MKYLSIAMGMMALLLQGKVLAMSNQFCSLGVVPDSRANPMALYQAKMLTGEHRDQIMNIKFYRTVALNEVTPGEKVCAHGQNHTVIGVRTGEMVELNLMNGHEPCSI